jgi:hypothetical protein
MVANDNSTAWPGVGRFDVKLILPIDTALQSMNVFTPDCRMAATVK